MRKIQGRRGASGELSRVRAALLFANGMGVVAATAFAAVGLRRPDYVAPAERVTPLAQFWSESSAVRTCALAGPLLITLTRPASGARPDLLVVAGLVQLGDAALGLRQRNPAMTTAPAIMGAVHLVSARVLRH